LDETCRFGAVVIRRRDWARSLLVGVNLRPEAPGP
jgi:hypothetical protein